MTRGQESPGDQLEHPSLVRFEVASVGSGVNGGMGFIVLFSIPRSFKFPVHQPTNVSQFPHMMEAVDTPLGESAPCPIVGLFLNERLEVKVLIVPIRLCTRVTQEPLLIELLSDLQKSANRPSSFMSHGRLHPRSFWEPCAAVSNRTAAARQW